LRAFRAPNLSAHVTLAGNHYRSIVKLATSPREFPRPRADKGMSLL
jgi:hypothetical protein